MSAGTKESMIFASVTTAVLVGLVLLRSKFKIPLSRAWQYGLLGASLVAAQVIATVLAGLTYSGLALMVGFTTLLVAYTYFNARNCPTCGTMYLPRSAREDGKPFCSRCGTRLVPEDAKKPVADVLD